MYIICFLLFVLYAALIIYYCWAWKSIPIYISSNSAVSLKISVIIAARDEEKNIGQLLQALQQQSYPFDLFEVIVVDDHSTDATANIVLQYPSVTLLSLKDSNINSYKKQAITTGISAAKNEWIVCTDADCIPNKNWLSELAGFQAAKQSKFIAAPVSINHQQSVVSIFQTMDFMILQGITGASVSTNSHSMCNGANLAYEKKTFNNVDGFAGIDAIASGDDMLLMHKIWKKNKTTVHFIKNKDAIVTTAPMPTWKAFFQQRIRWASKAKSYDDKRITIVLAIVYLFNLSFLILLVFSIFDIQYLVAFLMMIVAKTVVELPFFLSVSKFFEKQSLNKYFILFQPLHILYIIVSGFFGQLGTYEWKGRKVK